jgi:NAD(P)-dependent dehydrogenase (short-subunit alcohol dehydrogenase family)
MVSIPKVWFGQCLHNFEHLKGVAHLIPVTASSAGFGRSLVELILKGGDIAVATLRTPSALDDLKQAYEESRLLILPLDVTNAEQIRSAFQAATDKYGRIDFVYNLAGRGLIAEVEGTPEEEAKAMFEVNFWGATRVSNEAVRVFREVNKPQGGHLFVISSSVGLKSMAGTGFYSASKHGQTFLCQNQVPLVHRPYSVGRCN